jgi:hypothetical protein
MARVQAAHRMVSAEHAASSEDLIGGYARLNLSGGAWRSLVAHLLREQGVGGSNPLAPTKFTQQKQGYWSTAETEIKSSGCISGCSATTFLSGVRPVTISSNHPIVSPPMHKIRRGQRSSALRRIEPPALDVMPTLRQGTRADGVPPISVRPNAGLTACSPIAFRPFVYGALQHRGLSLQSPMLRVAQHFLARRDKVPVPANPQASQERHYRKTSRLRFRRSGRH